MTTYEALHAAVKAVAARLGTDIRVAYFGNCGSHYDDRAWYISVEGIRGGSSYNQTLTLGTFSTEQLTYLLASVERGGIEQMIGKAKGRWAADRSSRTEMPSHHGYRFAPVLDTWGEVVETPAQVEAALAGIPAIEFVPRPRRVRA